MSKHSRKRMVVTQKAMKRDVLDYPVYFFTFATPLFEVPAIEIFATRMRLKPVLITSIL